MKNKAVVVVVVLGSLIIAMFTGCWQSPLKYIPPRVDSINSDKSRMGLNGKVKTVVRNSIVQEKYDEQGRSVDERPGFEILYKNFQDYDYDASGNWIETKNFKDYVDFGTGLGRILKPYVERIFTYYEE
ncbi:hypothetical protein [Bacteroides congonensis]|uniref:hypothetical protein n=1 Tax=Bacteroides congonensis TaxID=1871006 RepID=UPI003A8BAC02